MNALPVPHDRFPWVTAIVGAAMVGAAFAPTYYTKYLFDSPPLTILQRALGVISTPWIVLHIPQARLSLRVTVTTPATIENQLPARRRTYRGPSDATLS